MIMPHESDNVGESRKSAWESGRDRRQKATTVVGAAAGRGRSNDRGLTPKERLKKAELEFWKIEVSRGST